MTAGVLVLGTLTACSAPTPDTTPETPSAAAAPQPVEKTAVESASPETSVSPVQQVQGEPAAPTKVLKKAPEAVPVSGTLMVVQPESAELVPEKARAEVAADPASDAPAKDLSSFQGGVLLATDDGQVIPLDPEVVGDDAESGQGFSGEITLTDDGKQLVQGRIDDEGAISEADALETLSTEADKRGEQLVVSGSVTASSVAASGVKAKRHTAYVVYYKNKRKKAYS
ncbi:MAG: hypothetical protein J0H64_05105, partial [Actinobacteria bacterium]|nr:hypothetical protein [Actinomycetota bacterium]